MSETLLTLLLGGAAQTLMLVAGLVAVLLWFERRRVRTLRKQPGTIEHLAAEIKRVETEGIARHNDLRRELRETLESLKAHDEELIQRYTRQVYDQMSALMYKAAEGRAFKGKT